MEHFVTGFFCSLTCSMLENMPYGRIVHLRSMDLWHVKSRRDENRVLADTHQACKNEGILLAKPRVSKIVPRICRH
jgi:hypothetical protein